VFNLRRIPLCLNPRVCVFQPTFILFHLQFGNQQHVFQPFLNGFIDSTTGKSFEVKVQVHEVLLAFEERVEVQEVEVCFFGEDEEVVGVVDCHFNDGGNMRDDVLEDKQYRIVLFQVHAFVDLDGRLNLLLLLVLSVGILIFAHHHLLHLHLSHTRKTQFFHVDLFYFTVFLVKVHVLLQLIPLPNVHDCLLDRCDQGVSVELSPRNPVLGVVGQAFENEIFCSGADVRSLEAWWLLYRFLDLVIILAIKGVSPKEELVIHHSQRPNVSLQSIGFPLKHLRSHRD
jgi:hypothetical protein